MPLSPEDLKALQDEIGQTNSVTPIPSSYPPPAPASPTVPQASPEDQEALRKALALKAQIAGESPIAPEHSGIRKFMQGVGAALTLHGPFEAIDRSQQKDNERVQANQAARLKQADTEVEALQQKIGVPAAVAKNSLSTLTDQEAAQRLAEREDPNSPLIPSYRAGMASVFGQEMVAKMPQNMNVNQMVAYAKEYGPLVEKAAAIAASKEKAASSKTERTDKEASIQMRKDEADLNKTKEQAMGLARMGNGPFRIASVNLYRSANGERIISQIKNGEIKGTEPEVAEIAGDIDAIVSAGGQSSVQRLEHFMQKTGIRSFGNLLTFISSNPQAAIGPQMLDEYAKILAGQKDVAMKQLDKSMGGQTNKLKYIFERGAKSGHNYEGDWYDFLKTTYPELHPPGPPAPPAVPDTPAPLPQPSPAPNGGPSAPAQAPVTTKSGFPLPRKFQFKQGQP